VSVPHAMLLNVFMVSTPSIRILRGLNSNFGARDILKLNSVPRRPRRSPFRASRRDINTEASVRQRKVCREVLSSSPDDE
jgi:hypothetical protein